MGWWSKTWKKVKNVFKKVTKVVKKVVKSVGKTAKKVWDKVKDVGVKVWDGVKSVTKKVSKTMSKLGPFANIAMNFIPGFGQLWSAYGIWGQMAKGALVGFATTGEASGALLGAASMGAADIFKNMQGANISEKVSNWFEGWTNDSAIGKAIGQTATKFKDALKPATTIPKKYNWYDSGLDDLNTMKMNPLTGTTQQAYESAMADRYAKTKVGENIFGKSKYGYTGTGAQSMAGSLLNKAKNALPDMSSIDPMDSAQATAGVWNPDTSPLQSVATNITAGPTSGQAGYGRDPNEDLIRSLGLSLLSDQYRASQQLFGA
jgi:hypothetical protein